MVESENKNKLIAVTETHLSCSVHYDTEVDNYYQNYNIAQAGKDTKINLEDKYHLLSGGGYMSLISPGIVAKPILSMYWIKSKNNSSIPTCKTWLLLKYVYWSVGQNMGVPWAEMNRIAKSFYPISVRM